METYSPKQLNELFVQTLDSPDGIKKVAQETSSFVRQKLREVSFARKIMNPQFVTRADLTRSVNHDGLVKIVDIEPDSKAMVVNFRGMPDAKYVMGERFEIPFFTISSEDFQKQEDELLAYEMPLTDIIERNSVLDIQKIEDTTFITHSDAAIAAYSSGAKAITGSYETTGAEVGTVKRNDFKRLFDLLDGDQLRCDVLLMDSTMYNRLMLYAATTAGSPVGSEVIVNGYTYGMFMGRRLVVSNKVSLLANKIYAFTSQDFLGQFLVQEDTKFWIEKKRNIITFSCYEKIGMGFGNIRSIAKLTLS